MDKASMANVLLGTCDEVIARDRVIDWSTSRIGGKPNWICSGVELPLCPLCARCRLLVMQLYCPLEASPFHRTLYVFACVSRQCWNKSESWCVLRAQKVDPNYLKHPSVTTSSVAMTTETSSDTVGMATSDWCTDADDWDDDDVAIATTEPVTMATVGVTTGVCSGDTVGRQQSNLVSMVTEANSGTKLAGIDVPCLDECGVMEVTSGGEKETDLTNAAQRLQCLQLGDRLECGNNVCGEGMEQGNCVIADDSALHYATDSVQSRLIGSQLPPVTPTAPCHLDRQKDVTLSHEEQQFVSYYISVFEEPEKENAQLKHERHLLAEYSSKECVDLDALADAYEADTAGHRRKGKTAGGGEGYEKGLARHGDEVFQKFTKRVSLCPQQLLRYSHGGSEVYITKPRSAITVPRCSRCGAERVFELQLMPALVTLLSLDVPIEFGTVLVYTCNRSCWQTETASVREEYIFVQPDPDQHLF